jgi:hypothetical protein
MARVLCGARTGAISLSANVTKTLLQLQAPANQGVAWKRLKVSFEGVTATDKPVILQILRQTDAGTGGNAVTETVLKAPKGTAPTPQATALAGLWATTEPSASDIIDEVYVHPQSGYEWVWQEAEDEFAYFNDRYAVRCITPAGNATTNAIASLNWEE